MYVARFTLHIAHGLHIAHIIRNENPNGKMNMPAFHCENVCAWKDWYSASASAMEYAMQSFSFQFSGMKYINVNSIHAHFVFYIFENGKEKEMAKYEYGIYI